MKNVYTIPENERENVLKLLTRYGKKAAAYGQPLSYEMGEPYATEIKVYKTGYDHLGQPQEGAGRTSRNQWLARSSSGQSSGTPDSGV